MSERRPQAVIVGCLCIVLAFVAYTQAGCGGGDTRRTTIAVEVAAMKSARVVFHDWDVQQQVRIAEAATSREDGEAKLAVYRMGRNNVTRAFAYVFQLLADAAVKDDEYSLVKARNVAAAVAKAIGMLQTGKDPPDDLGLPCGGLNPAVPEQFRDCP